MSTTIPPSQVGDPAATAQAAAAAEPDTGEEGSVEEAGSGRGHFLLFRAMPAWMVSGLVHFVTILVLAVLTIEPQVANSIVQMTAPPSEAVEEVQELQEEKIEINVDETLISEQRSDVVQQLTAEVVRTTDTPMVAMDVDVAPIQVELSDFGEETAPKNDLLKSIGSFTGSGVDGRGMAMRGQMVTEFGGTSESEAAVAAALKWLASHQNQDGSWNFDHRTGPCQGRCTHPGSLIDCRTGATAMALLPFLGAGQTHHEGKYKKNVEAGLYFLSSQMKVTNRRGLQCGDLAQGGGNMYSHGLAAITLCEAYAMTQDKRLMADAQMSLNHIMYAQDPIGGGWRYSPRQAGDTSVVGWQLMALKSGHMAYLKVHKETIHGTEIFLDSVQADGGAKYGYTGPGQGPATSAVGLLCRMYLGWKQDHPGLKRGVEALANAGPATDKGPKSPNMYYNYYATQVMRHQAGEPGSETYPAWEKWNNELRDWLIAKQDKKGHQEGSWEMKGDHGSEKGGRLYCTSMATMILEVYYRHMPIYGKAAAEEEFPL
ncbi:MAG: hypothetical protein WD872_12680 [Pirellulaceae bacterium]